MGSLRQPANMIHDWSIISHAQIGRRKYLRRARDFVRLGRGVSVRFGEKKGPDVGSRVEGATVRRHMGGAHGVHKGCSTPIDRLRKAPRPGLKALGLRLKVEAPPR